MRSTDVIACWLPLIAGTKAFFTLLKGIAHSEKLWRCTRLLHFSEWAYAQPASAACRFFFFFSFFNNELLTLCTSANCCYMSSAAGCVLQRKAKFWLQCVGYFRAVMSCLFHSHSLCICVSEIGSGKAWPRLGPNHLSEAQGFLEAFHSLIFTLWESIVHLTPTFCLCPRPVVI